MPRPRKCRKVCCLPENDTFGPMATSNQERKYLDMTVDEYEVIRLIDLEGMQQEECADKMQVARTTVQRIYNEARKKIAMSIVEGYTLTISGGDYQLCGEQDESCRCKNCHKSL